MRQRSVVELIVLTLTFVVAFSIVAVSVTVAIVEVRDPTVDTSNIVQALISVIGTILGALLGLIAGKSEALNQKRREDE